jgi:hypothetical protein
MAVDSLTQGRQPSMSVIARLQLDLTIRNEE